MSSDGRDARKKSAALTIGAIRMLNEGQAGPLYQRLFARIRDLIADGSLPTGTRLPASRALAKSLDISRNSVVLAFEQLAADGWVRSRRGAGVFVARPTQGRVCDSLLLPAPIGDPELGAFSLAVPALDLFPMKTWNRLQSRRWRAMPLGALAEGPGAGWPDLRDAIVRHLATTRGLRCHGSQVFVTTSVRAGIDLVVRALGLSNTTAWSEDPGYFGFRDALAASGVRTRPIPVDGQGLDVAYAKAAYPQARLAVLTPAAQFPTGVEMSAERRIELIEWARRNHAWILEDDYDSENHFGGLPAPPIATVAPDLTIYLNSFNRMLFPALRIAFMVLPEALADRVAKARSGADGHTTVPNQMVMADFINEGALDQHMRRCRAAYRDRRAALLGAIDAQLGEFLEPRPSPVGLRVVARLRHLSEAQAQAAADEAGIYLTPMSRFLEKAVRPPEVVLGFAGFTPAAITGSAEKLRASFERARSGST